MKASHPLKLSRAMYGLALLAFAMSTQAQLRSPRKEAVPAAAPQAAASAAEASRSPEKEAAGQLAAAGWLSLLDRRDWGSAWERSGAVFREKVPLASWMDAIPKVREPFGALVERQPAETVYKTSLPGHAEGDYVSVIYNSRFEKKPDAQEIVTTVREADGRWRVMGYSTR